jgi:hypothetical protein
MKFQVIKCTPMESKPSAENAWRASMVKGLFTDDLGEVEMMEVMLFGERGALPPVYTAGEMCAPIVQVRRNKSNGRPELVIGSLTKMTASATGPKAVAA